MKHLNALARAWKAVYGPPPDDTLTIDCETSGFAADDRVLQIGWLKAAGSTEVERGSVVLDWTRVLDRFGRDDLARRLRDTGEKMAARGRPHGWSLERLAAEGTHPRVAFDAFAARLADRPVLVGHRAWKFDVPVLDRLAVGLTGIPLNVPPTRLIDTDALVRAAQSGAVPRPGETYAGWAQRTAAVGGTKYRSNLDEFCVREFRLAERFGVDRAKAHDAAYDCYLSWLVYGSFREVVATGIAPWLATAATLPF